MLRLIKALHCSIEQEEALLKDYRIEKLGREQYLCMEESRKMLEAISKSPASFLVDKKTEYTTHNQQVIHHLPNINLLLQYVLDRELEQPNGSLKMIIQPEYTFFKDYLLGGLSWTQKAALQIEHIVALHDVTVPLFSQKNIRTTGFCLHLSSVYSKNYQVYYHYKNDFTSDLFPFCILTSSCGILISADYQTALFFQKADTLAALNQMFFTLKEKSSPLLKTQSTPTEFLQSYESIYNADITVDSIAEISYMPCIVPNIPPQAALRRMNPELAKSPYIVNFLNTYWRNLSYIKSIKIVSVFSLKGLELFMHTGICYELPKNCCSPFSPEERIEILKGFLEDCLKKNMIPILLKDNRLNISPELYLTVYNKKKVHFLWNPQTTAFSSCVIQESGMKKSLIDFLHYIPTTGEDTYSIEESLTLIKDFCRRYFH